MQKRARPDIYQAIPTVTLNKQIKRK